MIKFDLVSAHQIIKEIAPNIKQHHAEISDEELNVDWDYYIQASMAGQCIAITARDQDKLVGYNILTISENPRQRHIIEANGNGLYVEKPYRGTLGVRLIKETEKLLNNIGIKNISYMYCGERFERLLERLGYKTTFKVWSKA